MTDQLTDRELDAWLAEHLLGWTDCDPAYVSTGWEFTDPPDDRVTVGRGRGPGCRHFSLLPTFSTGDGMVLVLEAMRARGWWVLCAVSRLDGRWYVQVDSSVSSDMTIGEGHATTLPRAVAEAAMAALEASE